MSKMNGRAVTAEMVKRVEDTVSFAKAALTKHSGGADGILVSFHIVKGEMISHYFEATDFPVGDWGKAMVAMGAEAKQAELRTMTGRSKE